MSRQDAMANADEAVPAIGGRAEEMTKLETIGMSSDAARHQKLHLLRADRSPPHPVIARISISHSLVLQPYY